MNRCSKASKPSIVSPDPMPTTPSSVSTRTIVAAKERRGTGSQAAGNGGSSGSTRRSRRMPVIRTSRSIAQTPLATDGPVARGFVDSGEGRQYRSDTLRRPAGGIVAGRGVVSRTMPDMCSSPQVVLAGGSRPMDYPKLDKVRRSTTPLQLDVVESFARGRISRREFIKRGTIVGLSMGSISAVIAACGGPRRAPARAAAPGDAGASGARRRSPVTGRHDPVAVQRPAGHARPGRMQDLGSLWPDRPVVRVPVHARTRRRRTSRRASPRMDARTPTTPSGPSSCARASSGMTARLHLGRRRRHDGAPRRRRQLRPQGRPRQGLGRRDRRQHGHLHPRRRQRQLPVPGLGVQRPVADHPGRLRHRERPSTRRRTGPAPGSSRPTTSPRAPRSSGTTPGGAARRRSTAPSSRSSMTPARWSPPTRAARSMPSSSSTSCRARRSSTTRTSRSSTRRPPTTARSGCARDTGAVRRQARPPGVRLTIDRPALIQQLFKGRAHPGQRPRHLRRSTRTSMTPSRSGPANVEKAKQLLADAGVTGLTATLQYGQLRRSRTSPCSSRARPPRPASRSPRPVEDTARSTAPSGAPTDPADPPCSGAAEFGIVDYGHRATPGRLPQLGLQDQGRLELVAVFDSPAFDAAFTEFQAAVGVDAQKAACTKIETILNDDVPVADPVLLQLPVRQRQEVHRRLLQRARADVPVGASKVCRSVAHGSVRRDAGAPVLRPPSQDGERSPMARFILRAGCSCRSSRCGCWPRSCSSSPTCCPTMSGGRSSARSRPQESVDALNEKLGTNGPLLDQYVRVDRRASSPSTSATRSCPASRSCPRSSRRSVAPPSWPASRCPDHDPAQHPGRPVRGAAARSQASTGRSCCSG